jgi:hypothetical protein
MTHTTRTLPQWQSAGSFFRRRTGGTTAVQLSVTRSSDRHAAIQTSLAWPFPGRGAARGRESTFMQSFDAHLCGFSAAVAWSYCNREPPAKQLYRHLPGPSMAVVQSAWHVGDSAENPLTGLAGTAYASYPAL